MQQQVSILQGDALEMLRTLPDESVQCVVTSPPYYGLRDYGTAEWDGGEDGCDHVESHGPPLNKSTLTSAGIVATPEGAASKAHAKQFRTGCGKCGATRIDSQIGLESSPAEYIAKLVAVFREVRRVLRKDGVAWVNMGDSYAGSWGAQGRTEAMAKRSVLQARSIDAHPQRATNTGSIRESGIKPKDLMGMPWRLAFALQADDGWYLRQDIIWAKPNPMPESVTDRCTKAHEYIFLLSKSERYFYDAEAISEATEYERGSQKMPDGWDTGPGAHGSFHREGREKGKSSHMEDTPRNDGDRWRLADGGVAPRGTRNKRSVWTLTTEPYPEAHFATFPTELPRICILAGSRVGDVILDPFNGSGTTGQVALELARQYIGVELNPEYVALTNKRLNRTTLGLPLEIAA